MIGQWEPENSDAQAQNTKLSATALAQLTEHADAPAQAPEDLKQAALQWLKETEAAWTQVCADLTDDQLLSIAFFYTRAEMTLSGFESGARNPAIHVFRYLKSQGRKPDKDTTRALKALTDNRFIPYGNALL